MRSLFLVALVIGVCTPAIMAQETAKAGIYGGIQNLRFTSPAPSKRNAKQKSAIYSGAQNLNFNIPETNKQDVNGLPQAPKSTFFSAISPEMDKRYAGNLPLNSRGAGSRVQCPPSCPRDD